MYNLNELVFEAMLENWKQANNGNPVAKMAIDCISYEYNRGNADRAFVSECRTDIGFEWEED